MSYKKRLEAFNETEKYKQELDFLMLLFSQSVTVLDYGCGNGYAVEYFNSEFEGVVYGYDKEKHNEAFNYSYSNSFHFDSVYFMHSIAHIRDIDQVLSSLDCEEVIVITPNKSWLNVIEHEEDYVPDETVVKHYNIQELNYLFRKNGFEVVASGQFGEERIGLNERLFLKARKL